MKSSTTTAAHSSGGSSADTQNGSGSVIIRIVTVPEVDTETLRFEGTPDGLITLRLGQEEQLVTENLKPGTYTSRLSVISPTLLARGYHLQTITCDDGESPGPSTGDVPAGTVTFNVEEGETVTSTFTFTAHDCICPREGSWTITNLPGAMVCTGAFNMTVPLPPDTATGKLIFQDGCDTILGTDFSRDTADLVMHRVADCTYEGTVGGSQDGIPMEIHFTWRVQNEEYITGELHSQVNQSGATCTMSRTFEMRFKQ
ncbi:MAG: hypothetical protein R3F07_11895 [Opitutaceae bacterium]